MSEYVLENKVLRLEAEKLVLQLAFSEAVEELEKEVPDIEKVKEILNKVKYY